MLAADNYSSKIGRELFVFLLYCKYFTCQTVTLKVIKAKESCFVHLKPGLPLMVSSTGCGCSALLVSINFLAMPRTPMWALDVVLRFEEFRT